MSFCGHAAHLRFFRKNNFQVLLLLNLWFLGPNPFMGAPCDSSHNWKIWNLGIKFEINIVANPIRKWQISWKRIIIECNAVKFGTQKKQQNIYRVHLTLKCSISKVNYFRSFGLQCTLSKRCFSYTYDFLSHKIVSVPSDNSHKSFFL